MLTRFLNIVKPLLTVLVIILLLQATGITGTLADSANSVALKTGLLDASAADVTGSEQEFDYNFTIKDLDGNKTTLDKFKGKVIFINLWATWCGPCRAEMPSIQKLYQSMDKEKVAFIILSIDRDRDLPKINSYIKSKSFSFPVYQPSGTLTEQLNVPSIPTTFVISKTGKILLTETGVTNFNNSKFKAFLVEETNK